MKKHQLAAMVLSVLSASIVIGCTKTNDNDADIKPTDIKATNDQGTGAGSQSAVVDSDTITSNQTASSDASTTSNTAASTTPIAAKTAQNYLSHVADSQIVPLYKNVAQQSQALNTLAQKHCQSGELKAQHLNELRTQWLELAKAWASAEIVNFGPAMDSMSNLYINYFPDERGIVYQGVVDLINENPNLTPEQLASESAVVQGIPGMEEVLFANDTLNAGQCRYIISASAALTQRLDNVDKKWQSSAANLLGIADSSSNDANNNLGLNRWINSILAMVEITKSRSLDQPLGLTGKKKGHLPADGAGESRAILTAKVAALSNALTDPMLITILAQQDKDTLADDISAQIAQTSTLLAQLPADIAKATPEQQRALYDQLTTLTQLIKRELMPVLGVQVGFNSTDGD